MKFLSILSLLFSIFYFLSNVDAFSVELFTINTCNVNPPKITNIYKMKASELFTLHAMTQKTALKVPQWLVVVCENFDCTGKVFKVETCKAEETQICYFGQVCKRIIPEPRHLSKIFGQSTAPVQNRNKMQPWWFPNDRIM